MNIVDLCGPALEREFYDKIINNIELAYPDKFSFIVSSDAHPQGQPFKDIPYTHQPKIVFLSVMS